MQDLHLRQFQQSSIIQIFFHFTSTLTWTTQPLLQKCRELDVLCRFDQEMQPVLMTNAPTSCTRENIGSSLSCDLTALTPRSREPFRRSVASAYNLYAGDSVSAGRRHEDRLQYNDSCSLCEASSCSVYKIDEQIASSEDKLDDVCQSMENAVEKT